MVLAQDEARSVKHNYIGTEHLLLGLLREEEGLGSRVLESLGVTVSGVRARIVEIAGQGDEIYTGQLPFTPRAKKVLELALREALSLGHNYIGTEHVLLGLIREDQGLASRILLEHNLPPETIRSEVIRRLSKDHRASPDYQENQIRIGLRNLRDGLQTIQRGLRTLEAALEEQMPQDPDK